MNSITFNSGIGANTIAAGSGVTAVGITGSITNSSTNLQTFGSGLQLDIGTGSPAIIGGRLQFDGTVNLDSSGTTTNFLVQNNGQTTTFNGAITGGNATATTVTFTGSGGTTNLNATTRI